MFIFLTVGGKLFKVADVLLSCIMALHVDGPGYWAHHIHVHLAKAIHCGQEIELV